MIGLAGLWKHPLKLLEALELSCLFGVVNHHAHFSAASRGHAHGDGGTFRGEQLHERPMHLTRVRPALGHLVFKAIQLAQDIDRDADVMLGETLDAGGVVKEDIGVENKSFDPRASCGFFRGGTRAARFCPL